MKIRLTLIGTVAAALMIAASPAARADAVGTLRAFVKDVNSGRGSFTQVVTSPDGKKTRKSSGSLEFQRPNRFRFAYTLPTEQLIVGDGKKVWLWDADLNQVTVRPMSDALGASPAALLSGGSLDKDFTLKNDQPAAGSKADATMEWVAAVPRSQDGPFRVVRVGFKAGVLAALEIEDGFGQRSRLDFAHFEARVTLPATRFEFTPPAGADVLKQP
ncbi:MAG: outer membrane lipoprotein chaperone LolA [Burkholderiales bacterium]|nr:outer membrane lipoprotein chaperone LolA [Burkholderiales bacterium]